MAIKGEREPIISEDTIEEIFNKKEKENAHRINRRYELKAVKKYVR